MKKTMIEKLLDEIVGALAAVRSDTEKLLPIYIPVLNDPEKYKELVSLANQCLKMSETSPFKEVYALLIFKGFQLLVENQSDEDAIINLMCRKLQSAIDQLEEERNVL